eukprot:m.1505 g.1505  ORF g.1505 m.1505 type:complete len:381 (+) comp6986_c0_seq1:36-1178(+)
MRRHSTHALSCSDNGSVMDGSWADSSYSSSFHFRMTLRVLTLTSCCLSVIGASLIILTYVAWKEIRSTARQLLVFLSIADLLVAASNGTGIIYHMTLNSSWAIDHRENKTSDMCIGQSAVSTYSALCSFFWTVFTAAYISISLIFNNPVLARRLVVVFHVVAWLLPAGVVIAALKEGALGSTHNKYTFEWCWINSTHRDKSMWMWITGKAWEIAAYFFTLLLYTITECFVCIDTNWRHQRFVTPASIALVQRVDKKLILVPLVFILLRITGTVRFLLNITGHSNTAQLHVLEALQGIGDCGQGFANAILFCIFNERVRHRLVRVFVPCCTYTLSKEKQRLLKGGEEPKQYFNSYTKVESDESEIAVSLKYSSDSSVQNQD